MTPRIIDAPVAIGICTFRRNDGLARLLNGLNDLQFDAVSAPNIVIVVVDNDPNGSAEELITQFAAKSRWPVTYHNETRQGLAFARNALLAAVPEGAGWLATIDDDEVPESQWLDEHLRVAQEFNAGLVGGTLLPAFETEPPDWIVEGRFFEIGPFDDGQPAIFIGAGNALLDLSQINGQFDLRFNTTGGEDEAFFDRHIENGVVAVNAADARVHETIPAKRACLRWLIRRHFRLGTTRAVIELDQEKRTKGAVMRGAKALARIARGSLTTLASPILAPMRGNSTRTVAARGVLDVAWGFGAIAGLFGGRLEEYPRTDAQ